MQRSHRFVRFVRFEFGKPGNRIYRDMIIDFIVLTFHALIENAFIGFEPRSHFWNLCVFHLSGRAINPATAIAHCTSPFYQDISIELLYVGNIPILGIKIDLTIIWHES